MPEESINIFISNIYAIAIFTGIFLLIFSILLIISRFFRRDLAGKKSKKSITARDTRSFILHRYTGLSETLFVTGLIFVSIIFMILLILLSVYFVTSFKVDRSLYVVFLIVFLILLATVYVIRSRILKR